MLLPLSLLPLIPMVLVLVQRVLVFQVDQLLLVGIDQELELLTLVLLLLVLLLIGQQSKKQELLDRVELLLGMELDILLLVLDQ